MAIPDITIDEEGRRLTTSTPRRRQPPATENAAWDHLRTPSCSPKTWATTMASVVDMYALMLSVLGAVCLAACKPEATLHRVPNATTGLGQLDWMAGSWKSTQDAKSSEEHWTSPAGNMMLGVHRDVSGERAFFEYLPESTTGCFWSSRCKPTTSWGPRSPGERLGERLGERKRDFRRTSEYKWRTRRCGAGRDGL